MKSGRLLSALLSSAMVMGTTTAPVFADGNEARIGETEYTTFEEAYSAAVSGDTIYLLSDVDITDQYASSSDRYFIEKDITINGNENTITVAGRGLGIRNVNTITIKDVIISNSINSGRGIDTRGGIGTIYLDNVDIETPGLYAQPFTVGGSQSSTATINITNSKIIGATDKASYAITVFNPVDLSLIDTNVSGWACFNLKAADGSIGSAGSTIDVNGGIFTSNNPYTGETNNYGAVKFEDPNGAVNVSFENTTLNISSEQGKYQAIASFDNASIPGNVTLGAGTTANFSGVGAVFATNNYTGNVTITGGTYNLDPHYYIADGYSEVINSNNTYTVRETDNITNFETGTVKTAVVEKAGEWIYDQLTVDTKTFSENESVDLSYTVTNTANNKSTTVNGATVTGGSITYGLILTDVPYDVELTITLN